MQADNRYIIKAESRMSEKIETGEPSLAKIITR